MPFLGLFKKRGLESMKLADVRANLREVEQLEQQLRRELLSYEEKKTSIELYAVKETVVSETELEELASDIEELEYDMSASRQELDKVREEKRAVRGIQIVLERQDRLKQDGLWNQITKLGPEQLEASLRKLGDMDADVSQGVDTIRHVLGVPATPKDVRRTRSPRFHQILDDVRTRRAAGE